MFKFLRKNKKGFTLIELIVVIAILAILVAIAIPTFTGITERAEDQVAIANARSMITAINAHNAMETDTAKQVPSGSTYSVASTNAKALWPVGIEDEASVYDEWVDWSGDIAVLKAAS